MYLAPKVSHSSILFLAIGVLFLPTFLPAQVSPTSASVTGPGAYGTGVTVFKMPDGNRIQFNNQRPGQLPPEAMGRPRSVKPKILRTAQSERFMKAYLKRRANLVKRSKELRRKIKVHHVVKAGAGDLYLAKRRSRRIGDKLTSHGIEKKEFALAPRKHRRNIVTRKREVAPQEKVLAPEQQARQDSLSARRAERLRIREIMGKLSKTLREQSRPEKKRKAAPLRHTKPPPRYGLRSP
jgi:hypothetical protein